MSKNVTLIDLARVIRSCEFVTEFDTHQPHGDNHVSVLYGSSDDVVGAIMYCLKNGGVDSLPKIVSIIVFDINHTTVLRVELEQGNNGRVWCSYVWNERIPNRELQDFVNTIWHMLQECSHE
jgi:hypothetical protein